jgi:predicted RNA-binding protein with PIN domain
MYTSKKPATYLIDGLNFIRSFIARGAAADEEALTAELISWLDELGQSELAGSNFRLILDGGYRSVGPTRTPRVSALFTEDTTADQIIFESAQYLRQSGRRVIVITSDRQLTAEVSALGVKVISCAKFFNTFKI